MNKQQKADGYDALKAHADMLELAVYDMVNGKFSAEVRVKVGDFDPNWGGGYYSMKASWRGMPLYLVSYVARGQESSSAIYTEAEIQDMYRNYPMGVLARVLMHGRNELLGAVSRASRVIAECPAQAG